jgi:hypothetical protein
MEEWLLAFVRYQLTPRVAVWRPCGDELGEGEDAGGTLVLAAGVGGSAVERKDADPQPPHRVAMWTGKTSYQVERPAAQRLSLSRER